jgi:hypothetical protein
MRSSLKIRTLLLLAAVLFTGLVLALPRPAQACWMTFVQDCTRPDGSTCSIFCPRANDPCSGTCSSTDEPICCP